MFSYRKPTVMSIILTRNGFMFKLKKANICDPFSKLRQAGLFSYNKEVPK